MSIEDKMRVHRFIGLSELEAICKEGFVKPLEGKRTCLYFFPDEGCYHHSREYELEYVSGLVGDIEIENSTRVFCCIFLDIPKKNLVWEIMPYADPDGGWYSRISCDEYHLFGSYSADDITRVVIYADKLTMEEMAEFRRVDEAYEFLKGKGCKEFDWNNVIGEFRKEAMEAALG